MKELEESLKDITVISGYLRVSYSEPLVSMNFLRNLQVIGGRTLESRSEPTRLCLCLGGVALGGEEESRS